MLMQRPSRFEHFRFLGDMRTQLVYDLDEWADENVINEIVEEGVGLGEGVPTIASLGERVWSETKADAFFHDLIDHVLVGPLVEVVDQLGALVAQETEVFESARSLHEPQG